MKVVLDSKVGFVLNAFRFMFPNLALMNKFVHVNSCQVWSGVYSNQKLVFSPGEGDVLGLFVYCANVAMLFISVLGYDAASNIG